MGRWGFHAYVGDNGDIYHEEDIYFADQKMYEGEYDPEEWGIKDNKQNFPNSTTRLAEPVDKRGFPTVIRNKKTGKIADIKVNRSGVRLPIHAGSCPQVKAICFALPSTGKTTFFLTTLMSQRYLNALAAVNSSLNFTEDLTEPNGPQNQYRKKMREFERQRLLPGNTLPGQMVTYPYYVSSREKRILLSMTDVSGEDCKNLKWNASRIIMNKYFLVMVSAADIINADGEYVEMIQKLINNLKIHRVDKNFEILFIITKADLLYEDMDFEDTTDFDNSIETNNSRIELMTHSNGFDRRRFERKEEIIKDYLSYKAPNLINNLTRTFKTRVHYFLIASLGTSVQGNQYDSYKPYSVDEPWVYILFREGLYPEAEERNTPIVEYLSRKLKQVLKLDEE